MQNIIFLFLLFISVRALAVASDIGETPSQELKQLKASTPMKVRGKKVYSEIDANSGPSDTQTLFDSSSDILKNIPKSNALLYQPERILGLPASGVTLIDWREP